MPRTRSPYPPKLRAQLIALARAGRTREQLAAEFAPSAQTIRNRVDQTAADDRTIHNEHAAALTTAEREELACLRRENRQLKVERATSCGKPRPARSPPIRTRNWHDPERILGLVRAHQAR